LKFPSFLKEYYIFTFLNFNLLTNNYDSKEFHYATRLYEITLEIIFPFNPNLKEKVLTNFKSDIPSIKCYYSQSKNFEIRFNYPIMLENILILQKNNSYQINSSLSTSNMVYGTMHGKNTSEFSLYENMGKEIQSEFGNISLSLLTSPRNSRGPFETLYLPSNVCFFEIMVYFSGTILSEYVIKDFKN